MLRKLTEAINIQGAELIGTAKGYDLFDMRTYAAAEQFVIENTTTRAGQVYIQNEQTFNQHINERQRLYFFVESDTNHVFGAAISGSNNYSDITIRGNHNASITLRANFMFEANGRQAQNIIFPFCLIPNVQFNNARNSLIINENTLVAVLPQLEPSMSIDLDLNNYPDITHIGVNAFNFNQHISSLTLSDNIVRLDSNVMFDAVDNIIIPWSEKPDQWPDDWSNGYENKIQYLEADAIENIRHERELEAEHARQQAAEIERQRIEREAEDKRQREEEERQKAERLKQEAIFKIRYKKEGKGITIVGAKSSATGELVIPEVIDDFPVTKIASFAFYQNSNLTQISIPPTIKEIGQGAFAYTRLNTKVRIPAGCKINKNAFYNSNGYYK